MGDLSYFKDREPQIKAFDRFWDQNKAWIIAYTGISGVGKTSLLEWLADFRCKPRNVVMVQESLGQKSEDLGSLFLRLIGKLENQKIISRQAAKLFRTKRDEINTELNDVRFTLQFTQTVDHGEDITQNQTVNLREVMRSHEKRADQRHADLFIDALRGNPKNQLVVLLLDNYDAFQMQNDPDAVALFWMTLENARNWIQRLHVVLASRERLLFKNDIQAFQFGLFTGYEDKLMQLEEKDSEEMLISQGVMDAEYRQSVYHSLAKGHPLVTRLAAEAYKKTPDGIQIKDIPQILNQDQAIWWLQDRVLAGLDDEERKLVECGLMCREFNLDILSALTGKIPSEVEKCVRAIQNLSFIQNVPNGWTCHPLFRRIYLHDRRRAGLESFRDFHKKAAAYFESKGNLQDSIYHLFLTDPEDAFRVWSTEIYSASKKYDHKLWLDLIVLGLSEEFTLPPAYQAEIFFQDGQRNYYLSKLPNAQKCYERALQIFCDIGDRAGEANCIQGLGDVNTQRWELTEARERYEQALAIYRAIGDRRGEANCIHALGDVHNHLSELHMARRLFQEALTIYRAIGDRRGEANCIKSLSEVHFRLSELSEARRRYEEALPVFRTIGDRAGEANCIQGLGDIHLQYSELSEARKRFEEALSIFRTIGSPRGSAKCTQALGDVHIQLSQWSQARGRYEEALAIHRSIGSLQGEANCICALGDVHYYQSELPEARKRYEQALPIYRINGDRRGEADCIRSLGSIYNQLSDLAETRGCFEEALSIYRALKAPRGEANCIQGLGDVYAQLYELPKARECYEKALTIYRSVDVPRETANCIRSLGDIYNQLSQLSEARSRYEEALLMYRAINDRQEEANCIQSLGAVLADEENWEAAEASCLQALSIFQALGLKNSQANAFRSLGNLYDYQKRFPQAVEAYTKALNLFPDDPTYYQNRASIYLKMREIPLAEADILTSQKISPDHPYLFLQLGALDILRGSFQDARDHFQLVLRKLSWLNVAWFGIGETFLLEDDSVHALEAYHKGLKKRGRLREIISEISKLNQLCEEHPGQAKIIQNAIEILTDWKSKE